jgi:ubiquinone biosynthesis protein
MLTLNHIGQYKDIALLMARYALWDFKLRADPSQPLDDPDPRKPLEADRTERAQAFARHLKEMGPTFVKFGQLLSTRPDIVPPEYIAALERFQDDLDPFPYSEVESTIKQELGESPGKLFRHFSREPLAAASLGQVHRATLKNGRDVAVKIQRPGVREAVEEDLKVIREIAETLEARTEMGRKMNLSEMAKQFRTTMQSELDYRQEARNAAVLSHNLTEFPHIRIPEVFEDYTNTRVLTTEMVHGTKISRLKRVPSGGPRLAASLMHAYLKQVGVDGFWHCDPHPGNLFVRGNELFLIDLGMVANISQELQSQLMRLLLSLTENRGEEVAGIAIELGRPLDGFDPDRFTREIAHATAHFHGMDFRHTNSGRFLFQVIALSAQHNLQIPAEVGLLAKTLLHLDGAVKALDPDFDPVSATRHYSAKLIAQKIRRQLQPRNFYTSSSN